MFEAGIEATAWARTSTLRLRLRLRFRFRRSPAAAGAALWLVSVTCTWLLPAQVNQPHSFDWTSFCCLSVIVDWASRRKTVTDWCKTRLEIVRSEGIKRAVTPSYLDWLLWTVGTPVQKVTCRRCCRCCCWQVCYPEWWWHTVIAFVIIVNF